jgi:hypothetical protein
MIYFPETIDTINTMSPKIFTHFLLGLCTWIYSVHARILKSCRGSLPWPPAIFSFCHVFPLPLSGLNWCSLSPLGGPGPSPSKMAPLFTGSAHTPLPGSGKCLNSRSYPPNVSLGYIDHLFDEIKILSLYLFVRRNWKCNRPNFWRLKYADF